jgi:hypothetical protein
MKFGLRYASLGRYSNGPAAVELAEGGNVLDFFHLRDTPVGRKALAAMP